MNSNIYYLIPSYPEASGLPRKEGPKNIALLNKSQYLYGFETDLEELNPP